jgi:hypothetical protein
LMFESKHIPAAFKEPQAGQPGLRCRLALLLVYS